MIALFSVEKSLLKSMPSIGVSYVLMPWQQCLYILIPRTLMHPDFKNSILNTLDISSCDSPARNHSRFGLNQGELGQIDLATLMMDRKKILQGF